MEKVMFVSAVTRAYDSKNDLWVKSTAEYIPDGWKVLLDTVSQLMSGLRRVAGIGIWLASSIRLRSSLSAAVAGTAADAWPDGRRCDCCQANDARVPAGAA